MFEKTLQILHGVKIPPQPDVLMAAHAEMQRDEPDLHLVANLLSKDVSLSGAVLKTINSPWFNLSSKVTSIQHAVTLLGLEATLNIVAGMALKQAFEKGGSVVVREFWDSATNVSIVAACLAWRLDCCSSDEAYLLGLFHDCGIPLMAGQFGDYLPSINTADDIGLFAEVEDRHYHTNHAVVGFILGRQWGLPQAVRDAILDHHHVDRVLNPFALKGRPSESLLAVLKLAEHADNQFALRADSEWERIKPYVLDQLGLSGPDCDDLLADMQEMLLGAANFVCPRTQA